MLFGLAPLHAAAHQPECTQGNQRQHPQIQPQARRDRTEQGLAQCRGCVSSRAQPACLANQPGQAFGWVTTGPRPSMMKVNNMLAE
jgi:hypothetical protein